MNTCEIPPTSLVENVILIPARSGSTRIKDKNIKLLNGKPLISYVISTAVKANCGPVFVSTDSNKYRKIAESYGAQVPYLRPKYLSTVTAPSCWVMLHFLEWFMKNNGFVSNFITFCPPTNPLLRAVTIKRMLAKLQQNRSFNSIVTYTKPKTHPFRIIKVEKNGKIKNDAVILEGKTINDVERSQDFPQVFEGSPACRISRTHFFLNMLKTEKSIKNISYNKTYDYMNCIGYEISQKEAGDIDTQDDFWNIKKTPYLGLHR